jgi:hypothetical protein
VSENKILRKIYVSKRDEVREEWRRLHNDEFYNLYTSLNIIWVIESRIIRRAGHVTRMVERGGVYRIVVGEPEGKRPPGRPRHKCQDNVKMGF